MPDPVSSPSASGDRLRRISASACSSSSRAVAIGYARGARLCERNA